MKFLKQARSLLFHRASGVPINPPDIPLSARIIPYCFMLCKITVDCGELLQTEISTFAFNR